MTLRLRLLITLLLIISVPTIVVHLVTIANTNRILSTETAKYLTALAESKEEEIEVYFDAQKDKLIGIATRTALRATLEEHIESPNQEHVDKMRSILLDAKAPFEDIAYIAIYNNASQVVSTRTQAVEYHPLHVSLITESGAREHIHYDETSNSIFIIGPIQRNATLLGHIIIKMNTTRLIELVTNYTGLGSTGEILIARRDLQGNAQFLHTRRFEPFTPMKAIIPKSALNVPITQALLKNESVFYDLTDYRGVSVLSATRYIESADLGLVVKIDKNEIQGTFTSLSNSLYIITVIIIISTAIIAYAISSSIVRPVEILTSHARRLQKGRLPSKLLPQLLDEPGELGTLARTFNTMARSIHKARTTLEKQVEERTHDLRKFQLAVENASDHILITDPDAIVLYANPGVERITGYSYTEILGKKAGDHLWGKQMPDAFYKKLWHTIQTEKKPFSGEMTNKRKDGTLYEAAVSISPILDDNGDVQYYVGIERDITKEKEIDKAKSEFVSLASHQLRTPLSTISWYTEMLLQGDIGTLSDEQTDSITQISSSNTRMIDLVNSLLNVSRLELGTFIIQPETVDLTEILMSVLNELKPQITTKQMKIVSKIDQLSTIQADPKLIRMVFQNLLTNAVKYTDPKGTINVMLIMKKKGMTLNNTKLHEDTVYYCVSDNGYGIPEQQQDKIFSKLFRADNVQQSDTTGTGLGLYIVKSIITQSHGNVWFESKEGAGTTFHVTLPASGMEKKEGTKSLS